MALPTVFRDNIGEATLPLPIAVVTIQKEQHLPLEAGRKPP